MRNLLRRIQMPTELDVRTIVAAAEEIASEAFGRRVRLECLKRFPSTNANKSIVMRCVLEGRGTGLPSSVVVKHVNPGDPRRRIGFLNDLASCEFLDRLSLPQPLGPGFLCADSKRQILIIEDLGDGEGRNLEDVLEGGNAVAAEKALSEYAGAIGRLHSQTAGRADEFFRIRDELGPTDEDLKLYSHPWGNARRQAVSEDEIASAVKRYRRTCEQVCVRPSGEIEDEIVRITEKTEESPGIFLAFAQGDQNGLGGFIRKEGRLRAFDFDCGGFRHALREGIPARMTWGCMKRVPRKVADEMERIYREELAKGCPDALDDTTFNRAKVEASAHWHVFHVNVRLSKALLEDYPRGPSTLRQQVVAWLSAFAEISEETDDLLALGDCGRQLVKQLRKSWPVDCFELPVYRVFL